MLGSKIEQDRDRLTRLTQIESMRESLARPGYKGEDYNVNRFQIENRDKGRRCTDCIFIIVFLAFIAIFTYVGVHGYINENYEQLLAPIDNDQKFCGLDERADYPIAYYVVQLSYVPGVGFTYPITPVCVKECPSGENQQDDPVECYGTQTGGIGDAGIDPQDCLDTAGNPTNAAAHYPYTTQSLFGKFCIQPPGAEIAIQGADFSAYTTLTGDFSFGNIVEPMNDIKQCKNAYAFTTLTAFVLAFIYMIFMKYFTKPIVWISLLLAGISLIGIGLLLQDYHHEWWADEDTSAKSNTLGNALQYFIYLLYGLAGLYFIIMLCLITQIATSIKVLETSNHVIASNVRIIVVPVIGGIIFFGWIALWLVSFGIWVSSAEIVLPDDGTQKKSLTITNQMKLEGLILVFGLFWIAELLSAIFKYIMIVAVSHWYFTSQNDTQGSFNLSKGLWWSFRYNFGSLSLGSFLVALTWLVRLIFEYLESKMKALTGDNAALKCCSAVCRCCLDCCLSFVKFLNMNAYVQVALTGENFCQSAVIAAVLALKHAATFVITQGVGSFISFLGKIVIAGINTVVGYLIMKEDQDIWTNISSPVSPLIIIFCISYLIASIFMGVYTIVSITVLQCMYTDVDICNQEGDIRATGRGDMRSDLIDKLQGNQTTNKGKHYKLIDKK